MSTEAPIALSSPLRQASSAASYLIGITHLEARVVKSYARRLRKSENVMIAVFAGAAEGDDLLRPVTQAHPERLRCKRHPLHDIRGEDQDMTEPQWLDRRVVFCGQDSRATLAREISRGVDFKRGPCGQWRILRQVRETYQHSICI